MGVSGKGASSDADRPWREVVRLAFAWALISGTVSVLAIGAVLWFCLNMAGHGSMTVRVGLLTAVVVGIVLLLLVGPAWAAIRGAWHAARWRDYSPLHWERIRSSLRFGIGLQVLALVLYLLTACALRASLWLPDSLLFGVVVVDAVMLLGNIGLQTGIMEAMRYASVVPYFEQRVGGIDTFSHGMSLARHMAALAALAVSEGIAPLSDFGWNDDLLGEPLHWHDPVTGREAFERLISRVPALSLEAGEEGRLLDDLQRVLRALKIAESRKIRFCLLLRHSQATSAQEWELRKGTCF